MYNIVKSSDTISESRYISEVSSLIELTRNLDSTVIPHSEDELKYRYWQSLICFDIDNNIIWHIALYKTEIWELLNLNVWEIWSVIVSQNHRGKKIWSKIVWEGIKRLWSSFDAIVAATINPIMLKILLNEQWFKLTKFPSSCYEWWKKYLSPMMEWWEEEFSRKAKFSIIENVS
jgi:hypothetical protein